MTTDHATVPVKRILQGADPRRVVDRSAMANPDCLDWYVALAGEVEP